MNEKELVRRIIDFGFIIKAQLYSENTEMLRSIMNIMIMEAEDVLEEMNASSGDSTSSEGEQRFGST
ncbi:MAG: hypothetical protein INF16_07365 [Methylobacterium sp.]|jgi:hypothetical protein|uniref:hypothetical protein n=1 Tax=Rhabdaerophilum sp. TaxID=2717341 RepID=UPI0022C35E70|nr:hypothetical protein [Methylobacterium sp.]MCE2932363.1 hypothetical protein [Hyphomicrobiales bacterium]MCZ8270347.1 hypothetical protein [Beijerinckiaceae bacterium]MCA3635710.1 hypothetical protein [Methylobacterium sp.]MCA3638487.1 hypothetical protein [Methylobacterium sp.]